MVMTGSMGVTGTMRRLVCDSGDLMFYLLEKEAVGEDRENPARRPTQ